MKLSSILALNVVRDICEKEAEKSNSIDDISLYAWFADIIRRVIVDDPMPWQSGCVPNENLPQSSKEAMDILQDAKEFAKISIANKFDPFIHLNAHGHISVDKSNPYVHQ